MKRITLVFAVWFLSMTCSAQSSTADKPKEHVASRAQTQDPKTYEMGTQNAPLVVEVKHTTQDETEATKNEKKDKWDVSVKRWEIGLTFAIAVAAFLQFGGIVGQIVVYRKQSKLALDALIVGKRSADAAKKSADALRDAERAWIIISPQFRDPGIFGAVNGPATWNEFVAASKNIGRTPAQLKEVSLCYKLLDEGQSVKSLPAQPEYRTTPVEKRLDGLLLVPQDSIGEVAILSPNPILTDEEVEGVLDAKLILYAYGFVKYKDVFGESHETRFGYKYHFPQGGLVSFEAKGFRREGPLAYNHAT